MSYYETDRTELRKRAESFYALAPRCADEMTRLTGNAWTYIVSKPDDDSFIRAWVFRLVNSKNGITLYVDGTEYKRRVTSRVALPQHETRGQTNMANGTGQAKGMDLLGR